MISRIMAICRGRACPLHLPNWAGASPAPTSVSVFLVSLPVEINSFFQSPDYVLSTWSGYKEDKEDKHVDSINLLFLKRLFRKR
jgi:hypothetical protein